MEEAMTTVRQIYLQAGVLVAILLMVFGAFFPRWFLGWIDETRFKRWLSWVNKPFALFIIASVLYFYCFINLSMGGESDLAFATIKALVLYSILFFMTGLINPEAVFASFAQKLGRFWAMVIGTLAFMATMTALGEYMRRSGMLEPPPLKQQQKEKPSFGQSGSNQENH